MLEWFSMGASVHFTRFIPLILCQTHTPTSWFGNQLPNQGNQLIILMTKIEKKKKMTHIHRQNGYQKLSDKREEDNVS